MTSGGASVPTVSGKTPDDQKKKLPDPVKVIKIVCDSSSDPTSGEKKAPAYEESASFSWTHRYPAKIKAVLWNFTQNSAKVYDSTTSRTMKYVALGTAVLLFLGILSIVLAHKDEGSTTITNKYGMAFTLDDAIQAKSEKRVLLQGVPGESVVFSSVNTETTTTASSQPNVTAEAASSESVADGDIVTTISPAKDFDNKDLPAEGAILIGSDDDDKSSDENDQRIVFIERLMGLHLTSPTESGSELASIETTDSDNKKKASDKWDARTRKQPKLGSDAAQNEADIMPHPMLKYAAAAMMSRLIAAAARAQMETQAREALLQAREEHLLRGGAKDKDDDAEEESVPVLLASLRAGEGPEGLRSLRGPAGPHMYGRPMSARSSRGPLGPQSQRMASMSSQRYLPAPSQPQGHPLLQQLQALQVLSALQRMQRQREGMFTPPQGMAEARSGEKGTPALVMVAIPIQSQESRQQAQQVPPPYMHQPVAHYRSYYPYASPYSAYSAYRPLPPPHPQSSYAMPIHAVAPPPPPPPPAHHYRPSPYAHSAPYVTQSVPRAPAMHPAYSHVRPVIEVPVEVPIPYHVPVPVAAYPATTMHAHGPHSIPVHAAAGRDDADNSAADSDQIVLFYDAELQNDNENQESNSGTDDLQSSASERRPVHSGSSKSHQFLASHQLPANPSANKLKLFREMMNQKYASQPGVRYLPISIATSGDDLPQSPQSPSASAAVQMQARMFQGQESQPQPAFIVIADDRDQPQAVERRR